MSYAPEFKVDGVWCRNSQRFATKEEAEASARARFTVWFVPSECRAGESAGDANYKHVDGKDVPL
jgi:hypothetical protein